MTTQSKFRVPKAELSGGYGKVMSVVAKKMWGEIADVAYVMFHNKQVTKAVFGLSRARKNVQARRPNVRTQADHEAVVKRFLEAAAGGDVQKLMDVLAPDVVMLSDGGGFKLAGVMSKNLGEVTMDVATVNGEPAVRIWVDDELDVVAAVRIDGDQVSELYFVRNPAKLTRLSGEGAKLSR